MATTPTLFCHSLRRRPSYASAIPLLLSQSQFVVREENLVTHDIAVPVVVELDHRSGNPRATVHLRFLLLSPSAVVDAKLESTIERMRRFAYLTTEPNAIIFLLNPPQETSFQSAKHFDRTVQGQGNDGPSGVLTYTKLQAEMMAHSDLPYIPLLPLNRVHGLQALLREQAAKHTGHKPGRQRSATTARDLMQLCTLRQPMRANTANVLSDTFASLQEIAQAIIQPPSVPISSSPTAIAAFALEVLSQPIGNWDDNGQLHMPSEGSTSEEKWKVLSDLVGEVEMQGLVEFWRAEFQM